jgi:FAD/FMN-containing dehydrogenase
MNLGVALDLARLDPGDASAVARLAEAGGLDLVAIAAAPGAQLDPWSAAVWVAGATTRVAVGVAQGEARPGSPADADVANPAVVAKARESLDALAPGRVLVGPDAWRTAPADATYEELEALAVDDRPVVVPVASVDDVRALVARVPARTPSRRSAAALARRVPGIAYDEVPASLVEHAIEPGDPGYRGVRSTYLRGGAPGLVLRPGTPDEVADALAFARRHRDVPLGIRSAGHGISGRSTNHGGIVIDLRRMNRIEVLDEERRLVRVGPGATWKQVANALDPYGWAIGSGDYGGVGVGGLATAGGIGLLSRNQGLTIDRVRAVELVLADGSQVRASAQDNPELFWAVRGAGANFGVATAFELEAAPVGLVGWAQLAVVVPDLAQALVAYGRIAAEAPRDTTMFLMTGGARPGQAVLQLYGIVDDPDPDVVIERLTPFAEIGRLVQQRVVLTPYAAALASAADVGSDGHQGSGEPVSRSGLVDAVTPQLAADTARLLHSGEVYFFQLRHMGGAIRDVPADATAFAHRDALFSVAAMGSDDDALDAVWEPLRRHFDGLYLSFESSSDPRRLAEAFPEPTLARLRDLKRRYDPDGLLVDNFPLTLEEVSR